MTKNLIPALLVVAFFLPMLAGAATMSCVDISNNLEVGSTDLETNGEVTTLQGFLNDKGYLKVAPTGTFGNQTETAVKKFQKDNKIYNSGLVGPITRAKIRKSSGCTAPVVNGSASASCTSGLKLCANGSYAARIGANCSWAVCPTSSVSGTSAGNTGGVTGGTTSNTTTSGGTKSSGTSSGGTCTATPPPVNPGPPPSACFNRTVTYYEYDTARGGFFLNGTTNANTLSPISQGFLAWRPPSSDMGDPGKMIIIRFKTDDAGYVTGANIGFDLDYPALSFISPTPCDYAWAYDNSDLTTFFNIPLTSYRLVPTFIQDSGAVHWYALPVLAENQVSSFFAGLKGFGGSSGRYNQKVYLKPNTYYYLHFLFADIYKGGTATVTGNPLQGVPTVANNTQLAAASDTCGDFIKEQNALGNSQAGRYCFGANARLDWMNSVDKRGSNKDNIISGLPAPGNGNSSCVASPVSGSCGPSNGQSFSNNRFLVLGATADLCSTGTVLVGNTLGPFKWRCEGSNGGTTASCSAGGSQPPPPIIPRCTFAEGNTIEEGIRGNQGGALAEGWLNAWYKNGNTCYTSLLRCYDGAFSQGTPNPPAGQQYIGGPVYEDEASCK